MLAFVCISLVAANLPPLPPLVAANLPPLPPDVEDPTTNVKVTAKVVRGKSWNLYNYFIGNEAFINLIKHVYNHSI